MIGEAELKNLADRAIEMSQAEQTEVVVVAPHSSLTRFANNYIHQNVEQEDLDVRVRSIVGKKIGVASSNDTSDEGLKNVVDRALNLARHQRDNAGFHSLPSPQPIQDADAYVEATARTGPEERAAVVGQICDASSRAGLTAAGAFRTASTEIVVANSLGVFAYARDTLADVNTVIMSEHGSGHAERVSPNVGDIDGEAIAKEAIDTALININQTEIDSPKIINFLLAKSARLLSPASSAATNSSSATTKTGS